MRRMKIKLRCCVFKLKIDFESLRKRSDKLKPAYFRQLINL